MHQTMEAEIFKVECSPFHLPPIEVGGFEFQYCCFTFPVSRESSESRLGERDILREAVADHALPVASVS